jgi:diacylglycerol kinase
MNDEYQPPPRSWIAKFRDSGIGVWWGIRGQCSFTVHFIAAALVIAAGVLVGVSRIEWCLLVLCITIVMAAEMFNSAIETIANAIDRRYNEHLFVGLEIGSAAVLIAAIGAAVTGVLVLGFRLGVTLDWWMDSTQ